MAVEEADKSSGRRKRPSRVRAFGRSLARVLLMLACAYVVWCAILFSMQDGMLYPRHMIAPPPDEVPFRFTEMLYADLGSSGRVEACFVAAPGASAGKPAPLVVFLHGNGELIDYMDGIVAAYRKLGCSVLLPEYRGYGRSAGEPSQEAIGSDAVLFYDQVIKRPDVDASRVVFHGRSLGAAVGIDLASRRKPAVVIAQSAFASVVAMAHRRGAPGFLATNPYRTDLVLPKLGVPVLIFHGTQDQIIPVSHGRKLAELTPQSVYVEYDCGHNDFPGPGNHGDYWRRISEFLAENGIITRPERRRDGSAGG